MLMSGDTLKRWEFVRIDSWGSFLLLLSSTSSTLSSTASATSTTSTASTISTIILWSVHSERNIENGFLVALLLLFGFFGGLWCNCFFRFLVQDYKFGLQLIINFNDTFVSVQFKIGNAFSLLFLVFFECDLTNCWFNRFFSICRSSNSSFSNFICYFFCTELNLILNTAPVSRTLSALLFFIRSSSCARLTIKLSSTSSSTGSNITTSTVSTTSTISATATASTSFFRVSALIVLDLLLLLLFFFL
mmetsp:Transcript_11112/g.13753  ORF Transcript_11112/g.13753 Transcript_11112/m.13753 type:complete len:247 (+) Transcript_11112:76-816(+)